MTGAGLNISPTAIAESIAATRWSPEPYPLPDLPGPLVLPPPMTDPVLVGTDSDPRRADAAG